MSIREAPLEPVRLELDGLGRRRLEGAGFRTVATVAAAAFAVGIASLAGGARAPDAGVEPPPPTTRPPIKLPIGQRMAEPDFTGAVRQLGAA